MSLADSKVQIFASKTINEGNVADNTQKKLLERHKEQVRFAFFNNNSIIFVLFDFIGIESNINHQFSHLQTTVFAAEKPNMEKSPKLKHSIRCYTPGPLNRKAIWPSFSLTLLFFWVTP